jgi:hypothetical protein
LFTCRKKLSDLNTTINLHAQKKKISQIFLLTNENSSYAKGQLQFKHTQAVRARYQIAIRVCFDELKKKSQD